ncbi:UDP-N-acetylmuramate dehydrogenase [Paenibacillus sp. 1P07SE]|uniref:UDP-N-acetylmuramate dehydrogenase n=1 Tax=Paenibacillus sp. 1P07SE TaxID=3132209 RepID=UPI0039A5E76D
MWSELDCEVKEQYELKHITTMGVGGPCAWYIAPRSPEALEPIYAQCRERGLPILAVGNGSNLLVDDHGFDGAVIHLGRRLKGLRVEGDALIAEAGVPMPRLAWAMAREGISGFEFMAGIPGTVGGGVIMNAGCIGKETADVLVAVTYLDEQGALQRKTAAELGLGFRTSSLLGTRSLILQAEFRVQRGDDADQVMARTRAAADIRKGKFPLHVATVGSTFKSPPAGPHPGRLIEEVGLKGHRVGGAEISTVHANWIINIGSATAQDVKRLMHLMQETVMRKLGIEMEPEVLIV